MSETFGEPLLNHHLIDHAEEAETILNNPLLADAFYQVRMEALNELATVKADDTDEILRLQAIVHCTQEVVDILKAHITRSGRFDGGMSAAGSKEQPAN